jgi:hypothetical protein
VSLALGLTTILLGPAVVRAQVPQPKYPEVEQRSGLITRFVPIESTLPSDHRRDHWYNTRWADPPNVRTFPNFYTNGGLYGLPWRAKDSQSFYPYFYGAPGQSTLTADSLPVKMFWRPFSAFFHPFKPVGMYYEQGSYVPVYDLAPVVAGPGPIFIPWYPSDTHHGG